MFFLHTLLNGNYQFFQGISEKCDKVIAFSEKCATIIEEF